MLNRDIGQLIEVKMFWKSELYPEDKNNLYFIFSLGDDVMSMQGIMVFFYGINRIKDIKK